MIRILSAVLLACLCATVARADEVKLPAVESTSPIPVARPLQEVKLSAPSIHALPGGGQLWVLERTGSPLVELQIAFLGDPDALDGRAVLEERLLATLLDQALVPTLEPLGARLDSARTAYGPSVTLQAPTETFEEALGIVVDFLQRPRLAPSALRGTLRRWRKDEQRSWLSAGRVAQRGELRALLGERHPLTAFPDVHDARRLRRRHLVARNDAVVGGGGLAILAGELDPAAVERLTGRLGWLGAATVSALGAPSVPEDGPRVVLVDHPGTAWVRVAVDFVVPDRVPSGHAELLAELLGGGATARLDRRLRDELGLVYGARASLHRWVGFSVLRVETRMETGHAERGIGELADLLENLAGYSSPAPILEPELVRARATELFEEARRLDSLHGAACLLRQQALLGQGVEDRQRLLDAMARATIPDLEAAARLVLAPERASWVLVGPADELEPQLENVGLFPSTLWSSRRAAVGAGAL